MELALLLKLVHIVGAILWVGGLTAMTIVVLHFSRTGDGKALLTALSHLGIAGQRVFLPISHVVLLTGLLLAWLAGWGIAAWTVLAVVLVAVFAPFGMKVLGPALGRALALWEGQGDLTLAVPAARHALRLLKLDLAGQYAVVALMVLKPGWTDPLLLVPAACLAVGGLLYALGAPGKTVVQPA